MQSDRSIRGIKSVLSSQLLNILTFDTGIYLMVCFDVSPASS